MKNKVRTFKEKQSFLTRWLMILLSFVMLYIAYDTYQQYQTTGIKGLSVGLCIMLPVFLFFMFSQLCTTIDDEGITITFIPFAWRRRWYWSSMAKVYVRRYDWMEFGGWGYRLGNGGVAYSTKGRYGIQLELKNGRKILIGTQKPEEVEKLLPKINEND